MSNKPQHFYVPETCNPVAMAPVQKHSPTKTLVDTHIYFVTIQHLEIGAAV